MFDYFVYLCYWWKAMQFHCTLEFCGKWALALIENKRLYRGSSTFVFIFLVIISIVSQLVVHSSSAANSLGKRRRALFTEKESEMDNAALKFVTKCLRSTVLFSSDLVCLLPLVLQPGTSITYAQWRRGSCNTKAITMYSHQDALLCPAHAYTIHCSCIASSAYHSRHPVKPGITISYLFHSLLNLNEAIGAELISKHICCIMAYVGKSAGVSVPKARAFDAILVTRVVIFLGSILV